MPCYEPPEDQVREIYVNGENPEKSRMLLYQVSKFEAILCALFNELDRRGIAEPVIAEASRNGLIEIMTWWENHKKDDKARLTNDVHKYSKDEQRIIKEILKEI